MEGVTPVEGNLEPTRDIVGEDYFQTMGIPIVAGREFSVGDDASAPKVAVVNETFAHRFFGARNPVGTRIGPLNDSQPEYSIVGVVKDSRYTSARSQRRSGMRRSGRRAIIDRSP